MRNREVSFRDAIVIATSNAGAEEIRHLIDSGTDLANGVNNRSYTIKPSATTTVPLGVNAELADLFSQKGLDALKNFASSFTNEGVSSKVGIRVKPSISVGTTQVPFPNYIKLEKKTGSSTTTTSSNNGGTFVKPQQFKK